MKKLSILLLFTVCILYGVNAQNADTTITPTIFWKITPKNHAKPSWFLGTNHAYGGSFLDTLQIITQKFEKADVLITDSKSTNTRSEDFFAKREEFIPYAKLFNKKEYKIVDRWFVKQFPKSGGLKVADSLRYPLWRMLFVFINKINENEKYIKPDEHALDHYLGAKANGMGKRTIGLDTTKSNFNFQNMLGSSEQIANVIVEFALYFEKAKKSPTVDYYLTSIKHISLYKTLQNRYQFATTTPNKKSPFISELLMKRNDNWLKVLPSFLDKGNCFIAVGLAHLMYQEGLIVRLRKMGYTIEPVLLLK